MRPALPLAFAALLSFAPPLLAQPTADDIVNRYIQRAGGLEKINAVTSLRRTGRYVGEGGFEAIFTQENVRPNRVREEFVLQGMTQVTAHDGTLGWKIDPFGGKKDAESLGEDELHGILLDADFDEPLVDYKRKGNKLEMVGMDQVEGTNVYKLRVTLPNGDVRHYYMDSESYVPIRMEERRLIRGAEQELETTIGDYKPVSGWWIPFSIVTQRKGDSSKGTITYEKIEANVKLDDRRFARPGAIGSPAPKKNK